MIHLSSKFITSGLFIVYYKLIEECVSHKSGNDPDFSRRFKLDVDPLIDNLGERGKIKDARNVTTNSSGNYIHLGKPLINNN